MPRYAVGYLFVAPAVLYLLATAVYPVLTVVAMGLQDVAGGQWHYVGVAHYIDALRDAVFWNAVRNTVIFTVASTVLHLTLGLVFALLLNEVWFSRALRNVMRGVLILPWVFSTAAAGLMWALLYHPFGLFNYLAVGVLGRAQPIEFLGSASLALGAVIAVNTWKSYPFYMVAILGELQSIPLELYDAAKVDGAGWWQQFTSVTLPQLRGVLIAISTLDVITTFGHVDLITMLTRGGPGRATETVAFHVYRTALIDGNLARGAAISTIMLGLMLLFTVLYLRILAMRGKESW
jgi:multiple sugar transport system permease protein